MVKGDKLNKVAQYSYGRLNDKFISEIEGYNWGLAAIMQYLNARWYWYCLEN